MRWLLWKLFKKVVDDSAGFGLPSDDEKDDDSLDSRNSVDKLLPLIFATFNVWGEEDSLTLVLLEDVAYNGVTSIVAKVFFFVVKNGNLFWIQMEEFNSSAFEVSLIINGAYSNDTSEDLLFSGEVTK